MIVNYIVVIGAHNKVLFVREGREEETDDALDPDPIVLHHDLNS
jgi:hypothetical protein